MSEAQDAALHGLSLLRKAVRLLLEDNPQGLTNVEIARALGLESPRGTAQKNYLTWTILKQLENEGKLESFLINGAGRLRYRLPKVVS